MQVLTECYVRRVSTRRVEGLVQALWLIRMPKSQVSDMAKELDEVVEGFRNWPRDQGPYTCLWLDAISQRCREDGRVVNVATVIATAVNAQGGPGRPRTSMSFTAFPKAISDIWFGWTSNCPANSARSVSKKAIHGPPQEPA